MSLELEQKLQDLIDDAKKTLTTLENLHDQIYDDVQEVKEELMNVLKAIHRYQRDTLEPNQKTLYTKLLEIAGEADAAEGQAE